MTGAGGDDRGSGIVTTIAGVTVFLAMLLLAVQVLVALHASSMVTNAASEAARIAAGSDGDVGRAESEARLALGRYADRVRFEWRLEPEMVEVRVRAEHPSFLPVAIRQPLGLRHLDRTVRIRREQLVR